MVIYLCDHKDVISCKILLSSISYTEMIDQHSESTNSVKTQHYLPTLLCQEGS